MLSILLPIYNYDVTTLVRELHQQGEGLAVAFEIIAYDDSSKDQFKNKNRSLKNFSKVQYVELTENVGRARIRNILAEAAQYPFLLFLDGDSGIIRSNFLQAYIALLPTNGLLYGGRIYQPHAPVDRAYHFHWNYGVQRESKPMLIRAAQPYHSFMTNNFVIPKIIFEEIQFAEQLRQYGHEDTLFGWELKHRSIPIQHLDNPVEHEGLELQAVFLEKTTKGIENLYWLYQQGKPIETRMLRLFRKIKRLRFHRPLYFLLRIGYPFLWKQLNRPDTRLIYFDLYKLFLLLREDYKNTFHEK